MVIRFSGLLLRFVDYQRTVTLPACTLGEALALLESSHPRLRPVLQDNTGRLRGTHRMFVNGELVPRPTDATPLDDNDEVEFLTAIAGG
ncbi:MoaD/ThiS family protein [Dactylosporangium sp. CA-139066]|uniref:MoaD/ThiS family protein n=1 Tax=Dactylosporangium sp. CA-139066 TaxID=3239930 RepID=UPI003D94BB09